MLFVRMKLKNWRTMLIKPVANDDTEENDEPDPQPMEIDTDHLSYFVFYFEATKFLGKLQ
jgi:hypothetical protein